MTEFAVNLKSVVVRDGEVLFVTIDNEVVMLSITNSKYYGARQVGKRIWELIEQPKSVSALCEQMMQEFEVDSATCEREVITFINQLRQENLVKVTAATS